MHDLAFARALHVLAVALWIGGVLLVTTVLLPSLRKARAASDALAAFEQIERRFAAQARVWTLVAGLSGFYMLHRLDAWSRYLSLDFWWLHLMTLVWLIFTILLFALEPLVLQRRLRERAATDPERTLALVARMHWALSALSVLAIAGAVAGSHGWRFG